MDQPTSGERHSVPVVLPSGGEVLIEVRDQAAGMQEVRGGPPLKFSDFVDQIAELAGSFHQLLDVGGSDSLEIEFSVAASVKTGQLISLLVEGGGTSTLTVRLRWNSSSPPATDAFEGGGT